jgi:hypothetical protein
LVEGPSAQQLEGVGGNSAAPCEGGDKVGKLACLSFSAEEKDFAEVGIGGAIRDHKIEHLAAASFGLVEADDSCCIR